MKNEAMKHVFLETIVDAGAPQNASLLHFFM
jgi:hypothetical protein